MISSFPRSSSMEKDISSPPISILYVEPSGTMNFSFSSTSFSSPRGLMCGATRLRQDSMASLALKRFQLVKLRFLLSVVSRVKYPPSMDRRATIQSTMMSTAPFCSSPCLLQGKTFITFTIFITGHPLEGWSTFCPNRPFDLFCQNPSLWPRPQEGPVFS